MSQIKVSVRSATIIDIDSMLALEQDVWKGKFQFTRDHLTSQINIFPEGVLLAEVNGNVSGFINLIMIDTKRFMDRNFSWNEISDYGFISSTHNIHGDACFGINMSASSNPSDGVIVALMMATAELVIGKNKKEFYLGSRIPRYYKFRDELSPEEYICAKKNNRYIDPEINMYAKGGMEIVRLLPNYFEDVESCNYGVLMKRKNPFYGYPFPNICRRLFKL